LTDTGSDLPVLEFSNADIGYDGRTAVAGFTATVGSGEVVAILGANGSGKSTIVRGLFGLAAQYGGTIRIFGIDRDRYKDWRSIGYVPQLHTIGIGVPSTVTEVVMSGRLSQLPPWRRLGLADRRAVADAIEAVDLTDQARTPVGKLSGGQQRRVLIARALATQPHVLVLDEPTAGVDAASQEAFARTLAGLIDRGSTVVLVAHELGPVAPLISRVIVMRGGAKAFDGPPENTPEAVLGGDAHHAHGETPVRHSGLGLAGGG
jgi:zinc transport system ATP-binding protein